LQQQPQQQQQQPLQWFPTACHPRMPVLVLPTPQTQAESRDLASVGRGGVAALAPTSSCKGTALRGSPRAAALAQKECARRPPTQTPGLGQENMKPASKPLPGPGQTAQSPKALTAGSFGSTSNGCELQQQLRSPRPRSPQPRSPRPPALAPLQRHPHRGLGGANSSGGSGLPPCGVRNPVGRDGINGLGTFGGLGCRTSTPRTEVFVDPEFAIETPAMDAPSPLASAPLAAPALASAASAHASYRPPEPKACQHKAVGRETSGAKGKEEPPIGHDSVIRALQRQLLAIRALRDSGCWTRGDRSGVLHVLQEYDGGAEPAVMDYVVSAMASAPAPVAAG